MTKSPKTDSNGDRTQSELLRLWRLLPIDQRDHFIEEQCSAREVFRLDEAGVLEWAPLMK